MGGRGGSSCSASFLALKHQLVLADSGKKKISSSQAHEQIIKSPAFEGRVKRVHKRLEELLSALNEQRWKDCFEIVWDEFQDLHQLYESVGIVYRNQKSCDILNILENFLEKRKGRSFSNNGCGFFCAFTLSSRSEKNV